MAVDLPTFLSAFAEILKDKTSAGPRVWPLFDERSPLPQIYFGERGGPVWRGWHQGQDMRVLVECYGRTREEARMLFSEVRDILLPPAHPTEGYYGAITVTYNGTPTTVNFSGIMLNAGPEPLEDPPTGLPLEQSYWIVPHF
jgi:hypothetical protein